MISTRSTEHPSAERLGAFVDGELTARVARSVEDHVSSCGRCASDVEDLRALFSELDGLPRLVPLEGFAARVLQDVAPADPLPLPDRLAARVTALLGGVRHPSPTRIQDLVEGLLAGGAAARVSSHLAGCSTCRADADVWDTFLRQLDGLGHVPAPEGFAEAVLSRRALESQLETLGHFQPSPDFADRVMAAVAVAPAAVAARETAPSGVGNRLVAAARRLVPDGRRAWAAVSGVAVTPIVTVGLVVWAVFSHPTLTPGALLSFAGWQMMDALAFGWTAASATVLESASAFRLFSAVQAASGSPTLVAGAFLAFSLGTVAALWVLYSNLIATHPPDGRYAHASL